MKVLSVWYRRLYWRTLRVWWALLDYPVVSGVNIEAGTLRIMAGPPTLVQHTRLLGPLPLGMFVSRGACLYLDTATVDFEGFDVALNVEKVDDICE